MSRAATSVMVFAVYLFVLGLVFLLVPNTLLGLFRIPETHDVWVRLVGMLVILIGFYYTVAARNELVPILRATVLARCSVMVFMAVFVGVGLAPPVMLVFGVVDVAAAAWTWLALRGAG